MYKNYLLVALSSLLLFSCQSLSERNLVTDDSYGFAEALKKDLEQSGFFSSTSRLVGTDMAALHTSTPLAEILPFLESLKNAKTIVERDKAILNISDLLVGTGNRAHVFFRSRNDGEIVKYQLITDNLPETATIRTNALEPEVMPIGIYYIWTEKDGIATSPSDTRYRIAKKVVNLVLD